MEGHSGMAAGCERGGSRHTFGAVCDRGHDEGGPEVPVGVPGGTVYGARPRGDESGSADDVTPRRGISVGSVGDMTARELGIEGERIATSVLDQLGYEVVARNWTCPYGEVDIIALDGDVTVFVEVKTRAVPAESSFAPAPELAVDERKQERYERMARWYLGSCPQEVPLRFDVMALSVAPSGIVHVRHLVDAFGSGA